MTFIAYFGHDMLKNIKKKTQQPIDIDKIRNIFFPFSY